MADLSLDEKVKRFNVSMEALDDQVNYLHFSASAKAHASIDIMAPALHNTEEVAMQTRELAVNIDDRTKLLNSHAAGVVTELHALRAGFASQSNMTRSVERQLDLNNRAIDHMSSVLHDVLENSECRNMLVMKSSDADLIRDKDILPEGDHDETSRNDFHDFAACIAQTT